MEAASYCSAAKLPPPTLCAGATDGANLRVKAVLRYSRGNTGNVALTSWRQMRTTWQVYPYSLSYQT